MKKVKFFRSKHDICEYGGFVIAFSMLDKFSVIDGVVDSVLPKIAHNAIPASNCVRTMCGIMLTGEPDFARVKELKDDSSFLIANDDEAPPSEETLRQTLDQLATAETHTGKIRALAKTMDLEHERKDPVSALDVMSALAVDFMRKAKVPVSANTEGFVPLDIDVFTMDNSGSHKEGVSWTYAKFNGYSPIAAYLGEEGWAIDIELRPGSQHCQNGTTLWLDSVIHRSRLVVPPDSRILLRADSGNDSGDNIALACARCIEYIIKKNWRKEKRRAIEKLVARAIEEDLWQTETRSCLNLSTGESQDEVVREVAIIKEETTVESDGFPVRTTIINRIVRNYLDEDGQSLLFPEVELDSWYTSLSTMNPKTVIKLYAEHGTSEQFHSELKSDLNIERLPSGKFATNKLILYFLALMYNVIRYCGLEAEKNGSRLAKHKAARRRVRTIMKEVFNVPVQVIRHARQTLYGFGSKCRRFAWLSLLHGEIRSDPALA